MDNPISPVPASAVRPATPGPVSAISIAASTGGPNALTALLGALPGALGVPVFIVQHMPPVFTAAFAERLNGLCALDVWEGAEGQLVRKDNVYLAPGGKHMEVRRGPAGIALALTEDPPENSCRPAADVLFRSVASLYRSGVLGVVLTGMGQDGFRGSRAIVEHGGRVLAQDEQSSVVWGMPGCVAQARLAEAVLPLGEIAGALVERLGA